MTADRDARRTRLKALEATRVADTPGVDERLVELSKRGRAGYVQLLLAADDVRALGRMARGVAAVAELDRVRLDTHRRTLAAERAALDRARPAARRGGGAAEGCGARRAPRVDAAVAARNRLIDDLDQRRDLAAQYVAELQQAQLQLERTVATADAASTVVALPIRAVPGRPAVAGRRRRSRRASARAPSGRFGTSIVRNGIEMAAAEGTAARRCMAARWRMRRRSPASARW